MSKNYTMRTNPHIISISLEKGRPLHPILLRIPDALEVDQIRRRPPCDRPSAALPSLQEHRGELVHGEAQGVLRSVYAGATLTDRVAQGRVRGGPHVPGHGVHVQYRPLRLGHLDLSPAPSAAGLDGDRRPGILGMPPGQLLSRAFRPLQSP